MVLPNLALNLNYFSGQTLYAERFRVKAQILRFRLKLEQQQRAGWCQCQGAGHPRRVSKLNYSRRCAEASAVQAHTKQGLPLAPGLEISYVIRDARKWEVDT